MQAVWISLIFLLSVSAARASIPCLEFLINQAPAVKATKEKLPDRLHRDQFPMFFRRLEERLVWVDVEKQGSSSNHAVHRFALDLFFHSNGLFEGHLVFDFGSGVLGIFELPPSRAQHPWVGDLSRLRFVLRPSTAIFVEKGRRMGWASLWLRQRQLYPKPRFEIRFYTQTTPIRDGDMMAVESVAILRPLKLDLKWFRSRIHQAIKIPKGPINVIPKPAEGVDPVLLKTLVSKYATIGPRAYKKKPIDPYYN